MYEIIVGLTLVLGLKGATRKKLCLCGFVYFKAFTSGNTKCIKASLLACSLQHGTLDALDVASKLLFPHILLIIL